MAMSASPTNGLVFPEATVERIAFGSPIGSARIAVAATAVPWLPPTATTAASRPARSWSSSSRAAPRPIASIAAARSPSERSVWRLAPAAPATAAAPTSARALRPVADSDVVDARRPAGVGQARDEPGDLARLRVERAEHGDVPCGHAPTSTRSPTDWNSR